MGLQTVWYYSQLPSDIVDIIERDCVENFEDSMNTSLLHGSRTNSNKRNSENTWIPSTHWVCGLLWHYVNKANRENFLYDLTAFDSESIQFTKYGPGQFYTWHNDADHSVMYKPQAMSNNDEPGILVQDYLNRKCMEIRKLSVVVQLSDPEEYKGGNLQLLDEGDKQYIAPRKKGTIIVFDSRTKHRVLKVTEGTRRSLVGWVVGPRWR